MSYNILIRCFYYSLLLIKLTFYFFENTPYHYDYLSSQKKKHTQKEQTTMTIIMTYVIFIFLFSSSRYLPTYILSFPIQSNAVNLKGTFQLLAVDLTVKSLSNVDEQHIPIGPISFSKVIFFDSKPHDRLFGSGLICFAFYITISRPLTR